MSSSSTRFTTSSKMSILLLFLLSLLLTLPTLTLSKPLKPGYGKVTFSTPLKSLTLPSSSSSKYQFCGLINEKNGSIKWHARPSPNSKSFKLRLLRLDKKALLRDMLVNKKLDIHVSYKNTGKVDGNTGKFLVEPIYSPSASNMKSKLISMFNVKGLIKRPPGNNRERRLRSGLYTDGNKVYSVGYDYSGGKNYMRERGGLMEWCKSGRVGREEREKLIEKVKGGRPDVVREPTNGDSM